MPQCGLPKHGMRRRRVGDRRLETDGNDTMARRESEVRRSFPASADAVSDGASLRRRRPRAGIGEQPSRDVAVLLVSELATNAVEHAHSAFSVSVHVDSVVRIEVADAAAAPPSSSTDLSTMSEVEGCGSSTAWPTHGEPVGRATGRWSGSSSRARPLSAEPPAPIQPVGIVDLRFDRPSPRAPGERAVGRDGCGARVPLRRR